VPAGNERGGRGSNHRLDQPIVVEVVDRLPAAAREGLGLGIRRLPQRLTRTMFTAPSRRYVDYLVYLVYIDYLRRGGFTILTDAESSGGQEG
jgi:hypothetical protein